MIEQAGSAALGGGELLYAGARSALAALWFAAALDSARFAGQLRGRHRGLAMAGAALLLLPALMSGLDTWDNLVARPDDAIPVSNWLWLGFDGLAPAFCLLLLRTLRERNAAQAALRAMATTDPLTGLFNRRGFLDQAAATLAAVGRQQAPAAVLLLDLDHFKAVNDACGHDAGDAVLRGAAGVLRATLRRGDLAVRWGGEEFAALLPFTTLADAATLAERLRQALPAQVPHPAGGAAVVTISIGVAPVGGTEGEAALAAALLGADRALYAAKAAGRDRVVVEGDLAHAA